jgi:hypothetical protein
MSHLEYLAKGSLPKETVVRDRPGSVFGEHRALGSGKKLLAHYSIVRLLIGAVAVTAATRTFDVNRFEGLT